VLPPEPRWQHEDGPLTVFNVGAGRLAVFPTAEDGNTGPVRLLDAATGSEIAQFLADTPTWKDHQRSEDGRYLVAIVPGPQPKNWRIRGIDFQEQREWQADELLAPFESVFFAPSCNYLALRPKPLADGMQPFVVRETATGRIVAEVRVPATVDHVAFSADGGSFVLGYRDADDLRYICAVSTRTGKAITLDGSSVLAVAPDSRCIIADRGDDGVWVADLADGTWRCSIGQPRPPGTAVRQERVHADSGTIAYSYYKRVGTLHLRGRRRTAVVRTWSALMSPKSGKWTGAPINLWFHVDGLLPGGGPLFAPDARRVVCREGRDAASAALTCYDVQTGQRLWRRSWQAAPANMSYTPDSRHILVRQSNTDEVEVLDAATGATERTIALPGIASHDATMVCDGRTLTTGVTLPDMERFWLWDKILEWLPEQPEPESRMAVRVFDFATGAPVAEAFCAQTNEWWLTEDRQSLITVYQDSDDTGVVESVIQCWDLPQHKPLRWIVGVPAALGGVVVSLQFGWRRWRRCRTPAATAQPAPSGG
jgi:hypothetical protein